MTTGQRDPSIHIREMKSDELVAVYAIDMREIGDIVYKVTGGELVDVPERWERPARSRESWDRHIAGWRDTLVSGGTAWGAFDGDTLAGIIVLRHHLTEGVAQLSALFVSRPYRRKDVAHRLVREVIREARAVGARELYVSATPSRSAIGFYMSQGFRLAETVNEELFALEPEDIHLIKPL